MRQFLCVGQVAVVQQMHHFFVADFAGQLVEMGKAVVKANPSIAAAFNDLPVSNQRLGFIIAAGQFGKVADGGNNDGDQGGKSRDLRNGLSPDVQRGFDAAVAFLRIP